MKLLQLTDKQKQLLQSLSARGKSNGIKYLYGSKAADLKEMPEAMKTIDCSGWTRWLDYQVGYLIPEGAQAQFNASADDNNIEIGNLVFKGKDGNSITHVGMIISVAGQILVTESSGSKGGVIIRDFEDFKINPKNVKYAGMKKLILEEIKIL
jgi:cell wall-associated NlpC family hydrolase